MTPGQQVRISIATGDEHGVYEESNFTDPHAAQHRLDELAADEELYGRQPGVISIVRPGRVDHIHINDDNESWLDCSFDDEIAAHDAAEQAVTA